MSMDNESDFDNTTQKYLNSLDSLDSQRKFWLRVSAFVCIAVVGIVYNWDKVVQSFVGWLFSSIGLITAVVWWFWTMRLIRLNIEFRREEAKRVDTVIKDLNDLIGDISEHARETDQKPG